MILWIGIVPGALTETPTKLAYLFKLQAKVAVAWEHWSHDVFDVDCELKEPIFISMRAPRWSDKVFSETCRHVILSFTEQHN